MVGESISNIDTTESLREWANKYWEGRRKERKVDDDDSSTTKDDDDSHYIDLLSHTISSECSSRLRLIEDNNANNSDKQQNHHHHPPSIVCRAFFQSKIFAFESWIVRLIPGLSLNNNLPVVFKPGDNYLFFQTTEVTPHEIIFTWQLLPGSLINGIMLIGVDNTTNNTKSQQKVYLGTGIEKSPLIQSYVFRYILLPFHLFYANLLLKGMVNQLEKETSQEQQNKKDK